MKTTTKSPQEMGVLARARKREPHAPLGGGRYSGAVTVENWAGCPGKLNPESPYDPAMSPPSGHAQRWGLEPPGALLPAAKMREQ